MLAPYFDQNEIEAGCDEAGRGCLAGPVVAAAVILPKAYTNPLFNDSKQLKAAERERLRPIIERDALAFAVAECSPQEIDEINILNASFLAMHRAVQQLSETPSLLLIDGNRFKPYPGIRHQCVIKGDGKYMAIAAASILAKTYRDERMRALDEQFPGYSWNTNVGYPTRAHRRAIATLGSTPHHRQSFRLLPHPEQGKLFKHP